MANQVVIVDYDPSWPRIFQEERTRILAAIGPYMVAVEHFGSTAVRGLAAKPIIDILVGVRHLEDAAHCIPPLEAIGYEYVPEYEVEVPDRRYFRKPRDPPRTHHLHLYEPDAEFWTRALRFRDYLRAHRHEARRYESLKRGLAAKFPDDRHACAAGKASYILSVESKARAEAVELSSERQTS